MHFSKEAVQMAERHGKTLRITGHEGKADQNHSEVPPHPCQNGHHRKEHNLPPTPTPMRTWRSELLCPADGKCCSHDGGFSANQHWNYHMIQIPLLGPRKTPNTKTRHAPQCSEWHYLQQPKRGSIPSVHKQTKRTRCTHRSRGRGVHTDQEDEVSTDRSRGRGVYTDQEDEVYT